MTHGHLSERSEGRSSSALARVAASCPESTLHENLMKDGHLTARDVERENERLRAALAEIQRQPKGHECRGYCRWMYGIACRALEVKRA